MRLLALAGSPSLRSRSSALLRHAAQRLQAKGRVVDALSLLDIPAQDLVQGHYAGEAAIALRARVSQAGAVLISTPVYKASFAGGLKAVLDLLDEKALAGKVVLPIATGGSPAHLLALEYALKPVLSALGARHILAGVYATDKQVRLEQDVAFIDGEVRSRLDEAIERLAELTGSPSGHAAEAFNLGKLALAGGFGI